MATFEISKRKLKTLSDNEVYAVKINEKFLEKSVENALEPFQVSSKTVFIKPNLCGPLPPKSGVVTSVHVADALIRVLKKRGVEKFIVGEGVASTLNINEVFEKSGYKNLALKMPNVELLNLEEAERMLVPYHYGTISLPKVIFKNFYINMPVMKTHTQTTITISLKNQKGLLLTNDKKRFHKLGLHAPIAHLANVAKPDLIFVDGTYGLEGDGPSVRGIKRKIGLFLVGKNMFSVDCVCSHLMGISPNEVKHLAYAEQIGIGVSSKMVHDFEHRIRPFKRANENVLKIGHIRFWNNPSACSQCAFNLKHALKMIRNHPYRYPKAWLFLFYHTLIGRIDLLVGAKAQIPKNHGRIICVGDCTRKLARKNKTKWIQGCPPKTKEIVQDLGGLT